MSDIRTEAGPLGAESEERLMKQSIWRGWRRRCPNCGEGRLLHSYLKVNDRCENCGEVLHHHRADDGPPYLTLLIVGHIIGPAMLYYFVAYEPEPLEFMAIFMTMSVVMSLWFLPRLKGVIVGVQWAARMHGFGHEGRDVAGPDYIDHGHRDDAA
ncbi:hypothetical protein JSE7799_02428 [Jannaschia seosinensis]|uniref:Zinc-finger protein n=1 Tax=Jannaschia seosinensis TaxID=313367 RepID=A0A0M7BAE2_9RHOB|nr:DUF983 domain-containing protein [Jannaschia seosinensis]CUH39700.1 hypothetical protein JSE7799_02428 [Jannaschia seosinensis]